MQLPGPRPGALPGRRRQAPGSSMPTARTSGPTSASGAGCAATASPVPSTAGASTATAGWSRSRDLIGTPRARRRAWQVCERNGRIFVWHHAGGEPPGYEVIGYRKDEADWTPWRSNTYRVRVHVQDLTENIIDRSHFSSVHDMAPPEQEHFEVRFSGRLHGRRAEPQGHRRVGGRVRGAHHDHHLRTGHRGRRGEPGLRSRCSPTSPRPRSTRS